MCQALWMAGLLFSGLWPTLEFRVSTVADRTMPMAEEVRAPFPVAAQPVPMPQRLPEARTKATPRPVVGPQVQMDVTMLQLPKAALRNLSWLPPTDGVGMCILDRREEFEVELVKLRRTGVAKVISQPQVMTLSGRTAHVRVGGEVPELIQAGGVAGVHHKTIGTTVTLLPVVSKGRIHLEVAAEAAGLRTVSRANSAVQVPSGQTVALVGLSACDGKDELLVLVTPRVMEPAMPATGSRTMTLDDVVRLCARGISTDIIVRHMDLTESRFDLSVDDLLRLHDEGVSDEVIRAMQQRPGSRLN